MTELHQKNVSDVGASTKQTVAASLTPNRAPNTDPENGQVLQPGTGFTAASPMITQGDQYLDKVLSKIRRCVKVVLARIIMRTIFTG